MTTNFLRNLPSVNELLESKPISVLIDRVSHNAVVSNVRAFLDELRNELKTATTERKLPALSEMADRVAQRILDGDRSKLRPVINATGILLHTGLGRSPLPEPAIEAMVTVAKGYASVEIDLRSGQRSQRVEAVEALLCELTGAEAAVVANNNAGATMLCLAALAARQGAARQGAAGQGAARQEVVVSRGQLIEIGGSFRLPDVMETSGAKLHEVGTTNKTRIADYENAINENTAALMRVHTSNFVVVGFTDEASLSELVELGHKHDLPVIDDIGSGALINFGKYGFPSEPVASDSVSQGADVVLFSGDKLMGGPQCGIAVGRKKSIQKLASHPMMRALRVDKLTLAALEATLRAYRDPEKAEQVVPLLALLATSEEQLKKRAKKLAKQLDGLASIKSVEAVEDVAYLGGGSIPTQQLATWCVSIEPASGGIDSFAGHLRMGETAVVGRVQQNRLLLDLRSVPQKKDAPLLSAVKEALGEIDE